MAHRRLRQENFKLKLSLQSQWPAVVGGPGFHHGAGNSVGQGCDRIFIVVGPCLAAESPSLTSSSLSQGTVHLCPGAAVREGQQGQIDDSPGQEPATFVSFCHYFETGSQAIHTGFTHRAENDLKLLTLEPLLPKLGPQVRATPPCVVYSDGTDWLLTAR